MHHRHLVVFPVLALWMSTVTLLSRPAAAQSTTQGVINGTAWQDTNPNFLMDPGEPPITGATVELWSTTSITGQPQLLQTTLTDALGRYQFTVNAINGPLPDFGCYQVRLRLPPELGGGVIRSQEICQVPAGGTTGMEFVVRGSVVVPPPTTNQGVILGTAFRDTNGNRVQDAGEAALVGARVEIWTTTSLSGQPTMLQATQTDLQGRYQFTVNSFSGPLPDFGCYEVRLTLPADLSSSTLRSQQICQVAAGGTVPANFAVPGGATGTNRAPSIIFLRVEPSGTQPGGTVRLQALGLDQDDDRLTYQWTIPAGTISNSEGSLIDWTAPSQPGNYVVQVVATDPAGASIQGQVVVPVVQGQTQFNGPPFVEDVSASTLTPQPGQTVQLVLRASDPDGDAVSNLFFFLGDASGARVDPNTVNWQAPTRPGIYSTYAVVNDGRGGYGWAKRELSVNSAQTLNPAHPSYGRAGQVLIDSHGYLLWVGINDAAVAQQAASLAASGTQRFVLGHIVPDPSQRHAFYLDPATVSLAEVTAEGIQTNVEQVSRRPTFYMPGGAGGFDTWALSGRLIQFVPAQ